MCSSDERSSAYEWYLCCEELEEVMFLSWEPRVTMVRRVVYDGCSMSLLLC